MANTFTSNYSLVKSEIGGDNQNWGQNLHDSLDAVDSQLINKFDKDNVKGFTSTAIVFTNTGASQGTISTASGDLFEDFEIGDKVRVTGATSDTNGSTSSPSIHTITNKSNSNSITVSTGLVAGSDGASVTITLVFEPGYVDGGAIDNTPIGSNTTSSGAFTTISASGTTTLNGDVDLGNAATDTITATAQFDSDLIPSTDDARDLGSSTKEWKDLYIDGTAYIDAAEIGSINASGGAGIQNTPVGTTTAAAGGFTTLTSSDDAQLDSLGVGTAASGTTGEIRATNNITAFYSSDKRLKNNIQPISDALQKIDSISGVSFDWDEEYIKSHGGEDDYFLQKHDIGVIAQEIQSVLPEVVREREDGYLAVKYEGIVPLLVQAIKELKKEVEELKK